MSQKKSQRLSDAHKKARSMAGSVRDPVRCRPTTNQQVVPFGAGGAGGAGRCLRGVGGNAGRADTKKPACAGKVEPVGGPAARLCNRRPI